MNVSRRDLLPIGVLLAVGLVLRIALSLVYHPAALNQYDSATFTGMAAGDLFSSFYQPPGYPLFLRIPHLLSDQIALTISVQHLLGVLTAALMWWIVFRLTGSRWLGLLPAGVVALDADGLLLEHTIMTETLFRFLLVAALAAALPALEGERPWRWLLGAGLLLGAAIWVRYMAVALVPVLLAWAFAATWPRRRGGLAAASAAGLGTALLVGSLVVLRGAQTGEYVLSQNGGWAAYSRAATFADCDRFTPPAGTAGLCESSDPAQRRHPDWYGWSSDSPAHKVFGGPPNGDEQLGAFGRRAILAQPGDYVAEVLGDLGMFFFERDWTNRNGSLIGPMSLSFRLRTPDEHCPPTECLQPELGIEGANLAAWTDPESGYYDRFEPEVRGGIAFFQDYQRLLRVHGPLLLVLAIASLVALVAVRGRLARAVWLLVPAGLMLIVFPVLVATYNVRYALPAAPLLAAATALAAAAARERTLYLRSSWDGFKQRLTPRRKPRLP